MALIPHHIIWFSNRQKPLKQSKTGQMQRSSDHGTLAPSVYIGNTSHALTVGSENIVEE